MPTHNFTVICKGRDKYRKEVLEEGVEVTVTMFQGYGSNIISSSVNDCPYNTGAHGQRCKASHPEQDKVGEGVGCPYSFDAPYAFEGDN